MITDERQKQLAAMGYSVREHTTVQTGYVVYLNDEPVAGTLVMSRNDGWRLADLKQRNKEEAGRRLHGTSQR